MNISIGIDDAQCKHTQSVFSAQTSTCNIFLAPIIMQELIWETGLGAGIPSRCVTIQINRPCPLLKTAVNKERLKMLNRETD